MTIYPSNNISNHFADLGLVKSDTVMIHGDAGVAGQYIYNNLLDPVSSFILNLLEYFEEGTVIVPTFTYSATENKTYIVEKTPSKIGKFSETFRLMKDVHRSRHPIFSVSCFGKNAQYYKNSLITDCFGKDTFFDKLYINNVKILTLGCNLNRVTFAHYVEQNLNISYRYFKYFKAYIKDENQKTIEKVSVRYFVRKLNLDTHLDLSDFENNAIASKKLIKKPFGRFLANLISAKDFFDEASKLIEKNEFALIKEKKT
jgi:aminoglycoside 3-N-acetyltransferase